MITKEEEQLVTKGDEAETLLQSAAFNTCINSMVESTFNNYVTSEPEAGEKREINYRHYRALVDVVNTLKQWVSVRDEINERLAHDTDDISREDQ